MGESRFGRSFSVNGQSGISFEQAVESARRKVGAVLLKHEDLMLLACEEITRTTTYEELSYLSDSP